MQHTLTQDKAEKDRKVAELEGRAHDVQMLKFGQACVRVIESA